MNEIDFTTCACPWTDCWHAGIFELIHKDGFYFKSYSVIAQFETPIHTSVRQSLEIAKAAFDAKSKELETEVLKAEDNPGYHFAAWTKDYRCWPREAVERLEALALKRASEHFFDNGDAWGPWVGALLQQHRISESFIVNLCQSLTAGLCKLPERPNVTGFYATFGVMTSGILLHKNKNIASSLEIAESMYLLLVCKELAFKERASDFKAKFAAIIKARCSNIDFRVLDENARMLFA